MQFLGKVVELPLLCNDRCLGLTVLSGEVPLLQYIDSRRHHCRGGPDSANCGSSAVAVLVVGDMPVVVNDRCVPGGAAGAVLAVVDVAVLMQRQGGVSRTVEVPQILRAV